MKWSRWCITASLNYENTMINIITMETVACLRSKCHLKQNLFPSWPWSFRYTSCISDFRCKTKYTNKKFCRTPGPAYLGVLPVLVIFCPLGPTNFKVCYIVCPRPSDEGLFCFVLGLQTNDLFCPRPSDEGLYCLVLGLHLKDYIVLS